MPPVDQSALLFLTGHFTHISLFRLDTHLLSHAQHPDSLPRRIFDEPEVRHSRLFRRGEASGARKVVGAHCRWHKEDCRSTIAAASRRGWSRILTGFPTAVILFKVIFRILPSNRKRQREVRTEACTTRCCAAKSCATKSRVTKRFVDRRQLFRQIAHIP